MMAEREHLTRPSNSRIIELVGAGGSGKTSIARELERAHGFRVVVVSETNRPVAKVRAGIAAGSLALRVGLGPRDAFSLFRKCSSVENGMIHYRGSAAMTILDEGPIRTLRDTRCGSFRERRAWWLYGKQVLARLSRRALPLLVLHVRLDDAVRERRYIERSRSADSKSLKGRSPQRRSVRLKERLARSGRRSVAPLGRALAILLSSCSKGVIDQISMDVSPLETPADIARRIHDLLQQGPRYSC